MNRRAGLRRFRILGLLSVLVAAVLLNSTRPVAAAPDDLANAQYNGAAESFNAGLYPQAARQWAEFIKRFPSDKRLDRVHYYLGICHLRNGDNKAAAEAFRTVAEKHPNSDKAAASQFNLGKALHNVALASKQAADFKAAAEALGKVAEKHAQSPLAPRALYYQAEILFAAKAPQEAIAVYDKLIKGYPQSPLLGDAYYGKGTLQQAAGDYSEAEKTFAAFLDKHKDAPPTPLSAEMRLRRAICLEQQDQLSAAADEFGQVAKSGKFHADFALYRQAQCLAKLEKHGEAARLFAELTKNFKGSKYVAAARLGAGKAWFQTGDYSKAAKELEPLAGNESDAGAEAAYWLGLSLIKQGKPQDALKRLEPAIAKHSARPTAPYLEFTRIEALYEIPERRAETARLYAEFADKHGQHKLAPQAGYMAALVSLAAEQNEHARQRAEAFLSDPALAKHRLTPAVLYVAAEAHLRGAVAGQQGASAARAEEFFRRLAGDFPQHEQAAEARLGIGRALLAQKKFRETVAHIDESLKSITDKGLKAQAYLLLGKAHAAEGNHKQAAENLKLALATDPNLPAAADAQFQLGFNLWKLGDKSARQPLERVVSGRAKSPHRAHALYLLGEILRSEGEHDSAAGRYRESYQVEGVSAGLAGAARYGEARCQFAKQDFQAAEASLTALLEKHPQAAVATSATYLRGLARLRQEQHKTALADLTAYLDKADKSDSLKSTIPDALHAKALCEIRLGQNEQGVATLKTLLEQHPDFRNADKALYELGYELKQLGRGEEAVAAFVKLTKVAKDPALAAEAHFHLGQHQAAAAEQAGDDAMKTEALAKAASEFSAGLAKKPSADLRTKLLYRLGDVQFRQQDFAKAAETLGQVLAARPPAKLAASAQFLAGESLFRLKQYEQALPLLDKAAASKLEPYASQALYRKGDAAARAARWKESETAFRTLLAEHPNFPQALDARYGLAWALQNQQQTKEAREIYEKLAVATTKEPSAKARFMLGELDYAAKKYDEAIAHFLTVAAGFGYKEWRAQARYEAGRCFAHLGKKDKAIESFQIVVDKYPDHVYAADAKRRIEELKAKAEK